MAGKSSGVKLVDKELQNKDEVTLINHIGVGALPPFFSIVAVHQDSVFQDYIRAFKVLSGCTGMILPTGKKAPNSLSLMKDKPSTKPI